MKASCKGGVDAHARGFLAGTCTSAFSAVLGHSSAELNSKQQQSRRRLLPGGELPTRRVAATTSLQHYSAIVSAKHGCTELSARRTEEARFRSAQLAPRILLQCVPDVGGER